MRLSRSPSHLVSGPIVPALSVARFAAKNIKKISSLPLPLGKKFELDRLVGKSTIGDKIVETLY